MSSVSASSDIDSLPQQEQEQDQKQLEKVNTNKRLTKKGKKGKKDKQGGNKREDKEQKSKSKKQKQKCKSEEFYDGTKDIAKFGEGDSFYIANFIKNNESKQIMLDLLNEVSFKQMYHFKSDGTDVEPIHRLVIAQTAIESDQNERKTAIYRMPGCNQCNIPISPWTKTVNLVREKAEKIIKQELNHCVVTLYRNESDSLGFHHDKILDLKDKSLILSISFGEDRPIFFRSGPANSKKYKNKQRRLTIMLRSGSLLAIGPKTNRAWQHCIPKLTKFQIKCNPRISLSMRKIATFQTKENEIIGQGKEYQCQNYPFSKSYWDKTKYNEKIKDKMKQFDLKMFDDIKMCQKLVKDDIKQIKQLKETKNKNKNKNKNKYNYKSYFMSNGDDDDDNDNREKEDKEEKEEDNIFRINYID